MTSSLRSVAVCLALLAAGTAAAAPRAWVQMTATGAQARVVTAAPSCPDILIDGHARPMSQRAAPTDAFPGRVCQADLPAGARRLSVEGVALPAAKPQVNRIVILGNSGCRLKGAFVQNCNDPAAWPFAKVAALAAEKRPDLIIHVGDYYYRETPCPAGIAGCAGSPYGDRWPSWDAELYVPAAPLLAAAPWVFARGNHEDCHRGGTGWFRLLDAAPAPKACPAESDTFSVDLNGLRLILVDSADTEDRTAPAWLVADFDRELDAMGHPHDQTSGLDHYAPADLVRRAKTGDPFGRDHQRHRTGGGEGPQPGRGRPHRVGPHPFLQQSELWAIPAGPADRGDWRRCPGDGRGREARHRNTAYRWHDGLDLRHGSVRLFRLRPERRRLDRALL